MAIAIILIGLILFLRDEAIITYLEKEKASEKKIFSEREYTYIKSKEEKRGLYQNKKEREGRRGKPKLRRI